MKFSPEGKVLLTIGKPGVAGNPPEALTEPTCIVEAPNGDLFKLCAVIDFGQFCVGDPACDLASHGLSSTTERDPLYRSTLMPNEEIWMRGRAWALWKALIVAAGLTNTNAWESTQCWRTIDNVLAEGTRTEV